MPDYQQFKIDRSHPGRWTVSFDNPPINTFLPSTIAELGTLLADLEADTSTKVVIFQSANPDFFVAHVDVATTGFASATDLASAPRRASVAHGKHEERIGKHDDNWADYLVREQRGEDLPQ